MRRSSAREWLDIVDDQDRVIGRDTRARIHALGHLHRSAHIVLVNTRDEVFVQLRSKHKDTNPGLWDTSAAGHIDCGETYLEGAVRELREELGVEVEGSDLNLIGNLRPHERNGFEFTQVFLVCSEQPLVLQREEIEDGRWLSVSALNEWIESSPDAFTDVFRIIWTMAATRVSRTAG